MPTQTNRRDFLKHSAFTAAGFWVAAHNANAEEPKSPAEKLHIAMIGAAGQADFSIKNVKSQNIVALCDVDEKSLDKAAKDFPQARKYNDWRKMLEQNDIDAVVIATPDHQHAHATVAALQLGKHVYCEKPLTHSVYEARLVQQATAKAKKATQMGTQIHAGNNYRRAVELLQAGAIGTVSRVHVWVGGSYHVDQRPQDTPPVPPHLHWDLWLGPAPYRPYHPAYHPFKWRSWWDFGGGMLADMACHHMDTPFWALSLTHPLSVETQGPPVNAESPPEWLIADYRFPARGVQPPVHLTWYHGNKRPPEFAENNLPKWGNGSLFVGDKGMLLVDYDKHKLLPEADFKDYKKPPESIPNSIGHHNEWIKACKEGTPTTCNFGYGGMLTESVLLGNVAYRTGKKIEWDAAALRISNVPEANQYLRREYRQGWQL
jgi:predicted dehydrogenase